MQNDCSTDPVRNRNFWIQDKSITASANLLHLAMRGVESNATAVYFENIFARRADINKEKSLSD
jgi:hypothetical protein